MKKNETRDARVSERSEASDVAAVEEAAEAEDGFLEEKIRRAREWQRELDRKAKPATRDAS